ncbi:hypothetical protein BFS30_14330 [Pedobacter steynii]|uniref:Uncharacterized protein n=1 Tax=Pedobacter steynii TaxID=430522 RepID=A0A1D7QHU2_9SPHI|nr:hypothetical protein BFS30_14330 [Pedobacter steynii]
MFLIFKEIHLLGPGWFYVRQFPDILHVEDDEHYIGFLSKMPVKTTEVISVKDDLIIVNNLFF